MDMDGHMFPRSGLLVQVGPNGQGWRLDTPEALAEYGSQEGLVAAAHTDTRRLFSKADGSTRLGDRHRKRPGEHRAQSVREPEQQPGPASTRPSGDKTPRDPGEREWVPTTCCVLTSGFWAAEVPSTSQWLRLVVNGESHTWFRPIRRLLR